MRGPAESNSAAWQAVLRRDRLKDGAFVWVALTTGIYCRPSCPARHAHPRNVRILNSVSEAQRLGYTACRRCRPDTLTRAERSVRGVLLYMEGHLGCKLTLNTLARVAGLSSNHLQQTFRRLVGLSPRTFLSVRRIASFRDRVKRGESITTACYNVGYGSSRALYELSGKLLGMTPAAYKRGGRGLGISYSTFDSTWGRVLISGIEEAVCAVLVGENDQVVGRQQSEEFPEAVLTRRAVAPVRWITAVAASRREDPLLASLPLELRIRIFQAKVWNNLAGRNG